MFNRHDRIVKGPKTQGGYERVLDEMANVRMVKVQSYGEDRYNPGEVPFNLNITFADIHRKYIRLKEFFEKGILGDAPDGESLRDCFLDLANYGAMGVQLLDLREKHPELFDEQTLSGMQVDQVAICTRDPEKVKGLLGMIFGTTEWHEDVVVAEGEVRGQKGTNQAGLSFNYQLMKGGVEFEVLNYQDGPNWVSGYPQPCLSHLGVHVDNLEEVRERLVANGYEIVQEVVTQSHTNPAIKDNRRYHYVIFGTAQDMGFDLKLIQRLPYSPEVETLNAEEWR
jgi:hypothetical protein